MITFSVITTRVLNAKISNKKPRKNHGLNRIPNIPKVKSLYRFLNAYYFYN